MKEEIAKAIRETLVISNPTSVPIAVKKIMKLINDTTHTENEPPITNASAEQ